MTVFTSPRPKISLLLTTFPGTKTFAETWPRAKALLKCKVKCKLHKLAYSSGGLSRRLKTIIYYDSLGWLIWASYWWLGLSLQLRMRRTFLILSKCVCCSNFTFARPLPHATFSDICALCADSIQIGKVASALQPSFLGFYVFHGHANCQFLPAPQWFLTLLPPNRFDIGDFWLQRSGRGLHPVYRKEWGMLGYGKKVMIVQVHFEMKSIIRTFQSLTEFNLIKLF